MMEFGIVFLSLFCLVGIVPVMLLGSVRIVPEYQRLVMFRLGRALGVKGPGMVLLMPIMDRAVVVDLREQVREVPHFTTLSQENIPIEIGFVLYFKVTDPELSALRVGDVGMTAGGLGMTILRARVGEMRAVDVISQRELLGQYLREALGEHVAKWGIKVTNIQIREIIPPRDIEEALAKQVSEERVQLALGSSPVNATGVTQTIVHVDGKVVIDGKSWDAISKVPLPPAARVRVQRVILEVEQDSTS